MVAIGTRGGRGRVARSEGQGYSQPEETNGDRSQHGPDSPPPPPTTRGVARNLLRKRGVARGILLGVRGLAEARREEWSGHVSARVAAGRRTFNEGPTTRGTRNGATGPDARLALFMDLDVEKTRRGQASVLTLRGEIDVYTAPRLREAIVDLVDEGISSIVVDMQQVDFLDSTGLGVLVEGLKRVKTREGNLSIVITQDKLLKIFDITGLSKAFAIRGSVDEALAEAVSEA